ncbi:hypothetical protein B0T21DRAFT_316117 [Apiosordaria backusii]|uniref:RRM domain-containing protein n=1 Tax=Apiosordaria backusii TaxID=314023 RepID=A0AA40AX83_9PEZI|nr:hypothetical protein B0T21DRAFT_316117 [Apiosordaria backusii]
MRPTTWLNNTRPGSSRAARDANSSNGMNPARLPPQFEFNQSYYGVNEYSGFPSPHQMFHPALHRSYSAPDHGNPLAHLHAHGGHYAHLDLYNRPVTPHAPLPLSLGGQYGLRPDAIPFNPTSPVVTPSPLPASPAPPTYHPLCYDECDDDCPFADPYLRGWLERKAKAKESKTPSTSPPATKNDETHEKYSPHKILGAGKSTDHPLPPGWLERRVKAKKSQQQTSNTSRASPPGLTSDQIHRENPHPMGSRGGQMLTSQGTRNAADGQNVAISRSSTPALRGQRSSTPGIRAQNMSTSQHIFPSTNSHHAFPKPDSSTASARPPKWLLQSFNGGSSDHLEQIHQAVNRAENAQKKLDASDSPCSSSNNSQQSSWSLEDVADDIQPEDSCSLFISDLPNNVTLSKLLGSIRGYDRVRYSKVIGSAALIVFFERNAAQKLAREGHLTVDGVQAEVCLAKKRIAQSTLPRNVSRVLRITGFIGGISIAFLKDFLQMKNIKYELDKVVRPPSGTPGNMTTLEWHFASHSQAATVMETIMSEPPFRRRRVDVRYGIDPCAGIPREE